MQRLISILILLLAPPFARAEMPTSEGIATAPQSELLVPAPAPQSSGPTLSLGLRFDASYLVGDGVLQGFGLPSLRLTAFGEALPHLSYRVSLGQTREFSTALLPQIAPVEAYVRFETGPAGEDSRLVGTVGMFTPSLSPSWTPDLSDLDIPDYHQVHRQLFLSRDLGAEVTFQAIADRLEVGVGAFNGTGILGQNTNNGRAFTFFTRTGFVAGDFRVVVGAGGFRFQQGTQGGVNFRSSWVGDAFLSIRWGHGPRVALNVDALFGQFEDNLGTSRPRGGAAYATVQLSDMFSLFSRFELLEGGLAPTPTLQVFQGGPVFSPASTLTFWLLYQSLTSAGATENSGILRMRLVL